MTTTVTDRSNFDRAVDVGIAVSTKLKHIEKKTLMQLADAAVPLAFQFTDGSASLLVFRPPAAASDQPPGVRPTFVDIQSRGVATKPREEPLRLDDPDFRFCVNGEYTSIFSFLATNYCAHQRLLPTSVYVGKKRVYGENWWCPVPNAKRFAPNHKRK